MSYIIWEVFVLKKSFKNLIILINYLDIEIYKYILLLIFNGEIFHIYKIKIKIKNMYIIYLFYFYL